jgi:hypothetical protein
VAIGFLNLPKFALTFGIGVITLVAQATAKFSSGAKIAKKKAPTNNSKNKTGALGKKSAIRPHPQIVVHRV